MAMEVKGQHAAGDAADLAFRREPRGLRQQNAVPA